jgi:Uma2 family endonuclease
MTLQVAPPRLAAPSLSTLSTPRVLLRGISWETYQQLLAEHEETSGTHFAYDQGTLEIMVLSPKHEAVKHTLELLVEILAEEEEKDLYGLGSTTFQRADLARGFEPDACFYFTQADRVRGKATIDLQVDPPPELVIEIDLTSPTLNKFPIFAALGIPEIWRYAGERVAIFTLSRNHYREQAYSPTFPWVTSAILTELVETGQRLPRPQWLRRVRQWARSAR